MRILNEAPLRAESRGSIPARCIVAASSAMHRRHVRVTSLHFKPAGALSMCVVDAVFRRATG